MTSRFKVKVLVSAACVALWSSFASAEEPVEVLAEVAEWMPTDFGVDQLFGSAVSMVERSAVIGIPGSRENLFDAGAAYFYEFEEGVGWILEQKLAAPNAEVFDNFGTSISLDGDLLAVGALTGAGGSVYMFEREAAPDSRWQAVAQLTANDLEQNDFFGSAVSLKGDRLAVGASGHRDNGAVYLFEREESGWNQAAKLLAESEPDFEDFGFSVSLDVDRVAIGASAAKIDGERVGATYVFARQPDGSWGQTERLLPLEVSEERSFGYAVSLDGDWLIVGDPDDTTSGSATAFKREPDGRLVRAQKLSPPGGGGNVDFGFDLELRNRQLVIGAPNRFEGSNTPGAAYVFELGDTGVWTRRDKLVGLGTELEAEFGISVSTNGTGAVVGAHFSGDQGYHSGSASLFEVVAVEPTLSISGTCPGEVSIVTSGVTPRSRIELYVAQKPGASPVESGPCSGTELGLASPRAGVSRDSDFSGSGTLLRAVGESQCGDLLQLLDEGTCQVSEVVALPSPP